MVNVSIYGLSSEGYSLASTLVLNGANVSIIDELKGMAFKLNQNIIRSYPDVSNLTEEEELLPLESEGYVLKNSDYVFFAPRIRKVGLEGKGYIVSMFKNVISNLRKDTTIVFNVPLGIGMNQENIELITHLTGLRKEEIRYYYIPLTPFNEINVVGYANEEDTNLLNLLDLKDVRFMDLASAEVIYLAKVASTYVSLITAFEAYKGLEKVIDMEDVRELYIDDVSACLFDLRMFYLSIPGSTPLSYLINGCIKSVEGYIKYIVDRIRKIMKNLDIKASRTKVVLLWQVDQNEIRGDRLYIQDLLYNKLKDYVGEVSKIFVNSPEDKVTMILACSKRDYARYEYNNLKGLNDLIVIKANPICEMLKL